MSYTQCPVCAGIIQRHTHLTPITKEPFLVELVCVGCGWRWNESYSLKGKEEENVESTR